MKNEVVTKEDLKEFRAHLIDEFRRIVAASEPVAKKPWLKNAEVRKLLSMSSNTIQRLRISGKLRSSKIGGVHYYRTDDIEKLLDSNLGKEGVWER